MRKPFPSLSDFEGRWRVERSITHNDSASAGQFNGIAQFIPDDEGLVYVETGLLSLDHHKPFKAERRYLWREDLEGISLYFGDGRPFHSFSHAHLDATHWCDPDTYRVTYDFNDWPLWLSRWHVSGPKKAYEMVTMYSREKK